PNNWGNSLHRLSNTVQHDKVKDARLYPMTASLMASIRSSAALPSAGGLYILLSCKGVRYILSYS
ncbi:hypothetical protein A2U01_0038450, partial [Trifolium medium]|nr:hypothetical protein [Trifolium medium]